MTLLTLTSPNMDETLSVLHSEPHENGKIGIGDHKALWNVGRTILIGHCACARLCKLVDELYGHG